MSEDPYLISQTVDGGDDDVDQDGVFDEFPPPVSPMPTKMDFPPPVFPAKQDSK